MTLQDILNKYAFEIYEYNKIRTHKKLGIKSFWEDISSLHRPELARSGNTFHTHLNTIKTLGEGELLMEKDKNGVERDWVLEFEITEL